MQRRNANRRARKDGSEAGDEEVGDEVAGAAAALRETTLEAPAVDDPKEVVSKKVLPPPSLPLSPCFPPSLDENPTRVLRLLRLCCGGAG